MADDIPVKILKVKASAASTCKVITGVSSGVRALLVLVIGGKAKGRNMALPYRRQRGWTK